MSMNYKTRYAGFIVYEDSAPEDWVEQLRGTGGMFAISPRHTPDDGKAHWHVIYRHPNSVRMSAIESLIPVDVPANGLVERVVNHNAYERYLLHLDDPDKQQFDGDPYELITTINGYPLNLSRELSSAQVDRLMNQIEDLICKMEFSEYSEVSDYLRENNLIDLQHVFRTHTIHFRAYINSSRWSSASG